MTLPPRDKMPLPRLDDRKAEAVFDAALLTEEECGWWEDFVQEVTPLSSRARVRPAPSGPFRRRRKPESVAVDLHGMTQQQAFLHLSERLERVQSMGEKEVLVITGRGKGEGVLRQAVPRWLEAMHCWVDGWSVAPQAKGGEGALVVRVKRHV